MKFEIELDDVAMETLEHIQETRRNKTLHELVMQCVERGMYQLDYRTLRNRRVYEEGAAERARIKELKAQLRK